MNSVRLQDPVLEQACERSGVRYEDLGLPQELTVWVDPGEVSCRFALIISHLAFVRRCRLHCFKVLSPFWFHI